MPQITNSTHSAAVGPPDLKPWLCDSCTEAGDPHAADRFNPAEFATIARHEESFWWYRGMRAIQLGLLDQYLERRPVTRAIEAGCGTGYFARGLQRERKM